MEIEKIFKAGLFILLALTCTFLLGAYASGVKHNYAEIELYEWLLTSIFGIFFLIIGINNILKIKK